MTRAMGHREVRAAALGLVLVTLGCGADGGIIPEPSCSIAIAVSPAMPVRGQIVSATALVEVEDLSGGRTITWSVRFGGAAVEHQVISPDDTISFEASEAGTYEVSASGSVGGVACSGDERAVNVIVPGARFEDMVVRAVPADPLEAAAQDLLVRVPGGADYSLGTLTLSGGVAVTGQLFGPGGETLTGYVRATPGGDALVPRPVIESFADAGGAFDLLLLGTVHDVLLVPDGEAVPPALLAGVLPGALDGAIELDGGLVVSGAVTDGAGDPVAGARVALAVGGVPSTVAVTDAAGTYSLRARAGGPVAVTVTPAPGSGLPALELAPPAGSAVSAGSTIAITYAAGLASRTVSPLVRQSDGATPAAGARLTWIMRPVAAAGSVELGGTSRPARGVLRHSTVAAGAGAPGAIALPRAVYDVLVQPGPAAPAGQSVRTAVVDLAAGAPASLSLAAAARLEGQVTGSAGGPVAGARVTAAPRGLLAASAAAGAAAVTGEDGRYSLSVAGPGNYDLAIDGADAGEGRASRVVSAPAPGGTAALDPVALPDTMRLSGVIAAPGPGPLAGTSVQLLCLACGAAGGPAVVAEAVTDPAGRFVLLAPDPGVDR